MNPCSKWAPSHTPALRCKELFPDSLCRLKLLAQFNTPFPLLYEYSSLFCIFYPVKHVMTDKLGLSRFGSVYIHLPFPDLQRYTELRCNGHKFTYRLGFFAKFSAIIPQLRISASHEISQYSSNFVGPLKRTFFCGFPRELYKTLQFSLDNFFLRNSAEIYNVVSRRPYYRCAEIKNICRYTLYMSPIIGIKIFYSGRT